MTFHLSPPPLMARGTTPPPHCCVYHFYHSIGPFVANQRAQLEATSRFGPHTIKGLSALSCRSRDRVCTEKDGIFHLEMRLDVHMMGNGNN